MSTVQFGIDLGGTKIEIAAIDHAGSFLYRQRCPTPQGDYEATLRAIAHLLDAAENATGVRAQCLGVGIPGAESPRTGRIKNANSTCLIGHALREDLQTLLRRPVALANDANCFALSEAVDGAGSGHALVFGIILGTGVGGGIVHHQHIIQGKQRISGEWGHTSMPWVQPTDAPPPACYCGRIGCIETYLSGPGLAQDFQRESGHFLNPPDIVALSEEMPSLHLPHPMQSLYACAHATLDRYLDRLARALSMVINLLDPDVIVVGGGLSHIQSIYRELPMRLQPYVFTDQCDTLVVPPRHGDSSGVRGAAWLSSSIS